MIQFGNDKIKEIYYGSDKIKEVYHGSDLVWKMDSGIIQDGYWVHKDTAVKTYFGADADFINNGVMSRPDWLFDAVEIKLCSGINDFELTVVEIGGQIVGYACLVFVDLNIETGEGGNDVLQNIDMSNTLVNTLPFGTFYSCRSLTSITLPDSLTSIGDYAFASCTSLTSINLPDSLTSIGNGAFSRCTSLTSITLPEGLTSIGDFAFFSCTSLTSINLPDSLTSIGIQAFYSCTSLTSINLPDSLTSIGGAAFYYCTSLSLVTSLPTIPPSLGSDVFGNTHANLIIKVPAQSVNAYKTATNWNSYANKISAI